jgi:hypothetical protein
VGMESTLRRHLAKLVEAGLIARRSSPDGKRFRVGTDPDLAFGLDLSPLFAAACRLSEAARAAAKRRRSGSRGWESCGPCCTDLVRDSFRGSGMVAGRHERTQAPDRHGRELAGLRRSAQAPRVADDLARPRGERGHRPTGRHAWQAGVAGMRGRQAWPSAEPRPYRHPGLPDDQGAVWRGAPAGDRGRRASASPCRSRLGGARQHAVPSSQDAGRDRPVARAQGAVAPADRTAPASPAAALMRSFRPAALPPRSDAKPWKRGGPSWPEPRPETKPCARRSARAGPCGDAGVEAAAGAAPRRAETRRDEDTARGCTAGPSWANA